MPTPTEPTPGEDPAILTAAIAGNLARAAHELGLALGDVRLLAEMGTVETDSQGWTTLKEWAACTILIHGPRVVRALMGLARRLDPDVLNRIHRDSTGVQR